MSIIQVALITQNDINTEKVLTLFTLTQEEEMLFYYLQYKAFPLPIKCTYFWTKCQPEHGISLFLNT